MRRTPLGGHRDSPADSGMGGARNPPDAKTRISMDDKWRRGRGKRQRTASEAAKRQQTNSTRQGRGDHSAARLARGRSRRPEAEPEGRGGTGAGEPPPIRWTLSKPCTSIANTHRDSRQEMSGTAAICSKLSSQARRGSLEQIAAIPRTYLPFKPPLSTGWRFFPPSMARTFTQS